MKKSRIPKNEIARLDALRSYQILDTEEERIFDDLARLAAQICGTSIALISLIDEKRQWFKAHYGLEVREAPRDYAYCAHTIRGTEVFLVEDSSNDERFKDNSLTRGAPHVRFYAGAPLITPEGFNIGTLCVIDHQPKQLTPDQLTALSALARQVVGQFELKKSRSTLTIVRAEMQAIRKAPQGTILNANEAFKAQQQLAAISKSNLVIEFDLSGRPYKVVKYALDISENRLAEQTMKVVARESQDKQIELDRFFELSQDLLCIAGTDGYFKKISPSFERVLGFTCQELLEKPFFDFIHPEDIQKTKSEIDKLSRGIPSIAFVARFRSKSGKYLYLSWNATPTTDGKLCATARDTTQLIETEKTLKAANLAILYHRKALDSAAVVAETDIRGRITYVNDKFVEMSKYSREELIGKDHRILNSGHHPKEFFTELWRTIASGNVWHNEVKNRAKDGTYYWVDGTIFPVKDENNKPQSYVSIRFDITDKKRALENLQVANKRVVIADQAKSDFLHTMSHEIRTPLNGIIGMTSLLQETKLDANQREFSETIFRSGKTLLTIINDILDFSKIEAGKMELEVIEFDFCSYLKDLLKPFQYGVKKKNINLNWECSDYAYYLYGDDGKIGQIVSNLVSNAVKFTKVGGVTVRAELTAHEDHTTVMLAVQDTGIGIPNSAQGRMFQAFAQAEKSTSRNYGGTGLGLSISKRLVEMMGGEISCESEYGKGTTFRVKLDLKTGKKIEISHSCPSPSPLQSLPLAGRILVAEDNSTNRLVISRMLDKWQCKYLVVANGHEVLNALSEARFDLILMDCQMPEMDGYTATKIVRGAQSPYTAIPIIALTANAVQGDEQKCRDAGMNEYLSKPIDKGILEAVLRKYLTGQPQPVQKPLINKDALSQFDELQMDGQPDILIEVIDSFLRTTPARIEAILMYGAALDAAGAAREAHALKSSARTLGAFVLGDLCQEIEDRKETNLPPISGKMSPLNC